MSYELKPGEVWIPVRGSDLWIGSTDMHGRGVATRVNAGHEHYNVQVWTTKDRALHFSVPCEGNYVIESIPCEVLAWLGVSS